MAVLDQLVFASISVHVVRVYSASPCQVIFVRVEICSSKQQRSLRLEKRAWHWRQFVVPSNGFRCGVYHACFLLPAMCTATRIYVYVIWFDSCAWVRIIHEFPTIRVRAETEIADVTLHVLQANSVDGHSCRGLRGFHLSWRCYRATSRSVLQRSYKYRWLGWLDFISLKNFPGSFEYWKWVWNVSWSKCH